MAYLWYLIHGNGSAAKWHFSKHGSTSHDSDILMWVCIDRVKLTSHDLSLWENPQQVRDAAEDLSLRNLIIQNQAKCICHDE